MYEFWYDCAKPNMVKKPNCFIVYIKTDDIYKNNAEDVESRFGTLNYELDWPSPK